MNNYDFGDCLDIIEQLRTNQDPDLLRQLNHELNSFFTGSTCNTVLLSKNTDTPFFGVCVMPVIKDNDIYDILLNDAFEYNSDDSKAKVNKYYVEIDFKLFNPILDLSNREILALILHDIGALVNTSSPIDIAKAEIDMYLDKTNSVIRRANTVNYAALLAFGFKDLLWKITSVMFKDHDLLLADDFLIGCGFGMDLEIAIKKLKNSGYINYTNSGPRDTSTIIAWCLSVYNDVLSNRIITIKGLRKAMSYTAIRLIKREIERVITALSRIDDNSLLEAGPIDWARKQYRDTTNSFKYSAIKDYENDLFEFQIRLRNIDEENDALLLLHSINTRLSIIDGVLSEDDLDEKLRSKYSILQAKYIKLREELAKRETLRRDYNRIYINYPDMELKRR